MKTRLLGLLAATAITTAGISAASAADLPVRAAPPAPVFAPVPVFTWTGFYAGVNAGYGWSNNDNIGTLVLPRGSIIDRPAVSGTITYTDESGDGFVGGGQIGYNAQFGAFVVGLEADIQYADLGADRNGSVATGFAGLRDFRAAGIAGGVDWFGTVRGRLGFAFDRALVYGTGGFAYGGGDTDDEFDGIFSNGNDDVRTGWVVGVGAEYAFTNNLTFGVEGLWVNLNGDDNGTYIGSYQPVPGGDRRAVYANVDRGDDDADFFVARAKLNFKFGTY